MVIMKIELMMMNCIECGSKVFHFDERLGEKCCSDCGLVIIDGLFEETVSQWKGQTLVRSADKGRLGSVSNSKYENVNRNIQAGIRHCRMVLSNLGLTLNTERIDKVYMQLYRKHMFGSFTLEERATAVIYYLLKENGTPQSMKSVCSEFSVSMKRTAKLVRKINQFYRNAIHYGSNNGSFLIHQTARKILDEPLFLHQANKVMEHFEHKIITSDFNKGNTYYAALCLITSKVFVRGITCKSIAEKTGFTRNKVSKQAKAIIGIIGLSSVNELKGKELEKIGE